ncbi:hypothetical protein DH2020_026037 [Rehmannia glutinosa]|uniref:Glycosyltransferase N-terminal domain-containing protein n=1 Tax=Rehmannia glutinosa TaxID=99300 RepID=A0ABR0W2F9_REHGL
MEDKLIMKPHAIMIALPYQGHLNPFVHLAIKLASKGCKITFVLTEHFHHQISKSHNNTITTSSSEVDIFSEAGNSGLDIRYTTISDGFPLEFDRNLNLDEFWESLFNDFPSRVDEFVGEIIESSDVSLSPIFLVTDTAYSWTGTIAKKYNILNVSFWTEPAMVFAICYYSDLLRQNGHFPPTKIVSYIDDTHVLPVGFEDDVKDRGLIVPWCNQIDVLSNQAVGGFLTTVGRNSIFESIWCGIPMICYPITYDQPTNRKLVVDDWKVGISLCDGVSLNREEVAKKIKKLMSGETSDGIRNEMKMFEHNA